MSRLDWTAVVAVAGAVGFFVYSTRAAFELDLVHVAKESKSAAAGFPRAVRVGDGQEFEVATKPQRVVPASARLIDFCAALLPPDAIAGCPEQAIEYTTLGDREAAFADRPRFREYLAEPVMAFEPDLVLADPWSSADTRERLRDAGITVLVVPDSANWKEACAALELLGRVFGEEERAAAEISSIEARVAALAARASSKRLRAVAYSNFGSQGFSAGSETTLDDAMRLAGIENIAASEGLSGNIGFTFEQLLAFDPDAIVVSDPIRAEQGHTGDKGGAAERVLIDAEMLSDLRAVRERRFLRLPAGLFASSSHGIVRAAEVLADERDRLLATEASR
jgi:iron complex transport system substrate-binding protein